MTMYHQGNRQLQDEFGSRALADRLESLARTAFSEEDKAFIESVGFFFLATADAGARPDCSFKAGPLGFVRVIGPDELAFPDYDGNGMFKSLGNIVDNGNVGMLFIAMGERPRRLRVNGRASVSQTDPMLADFEGAQLIVRVKAKHIFPNCPRYIPDMTAQMPSVYLPKKGEAPVEPVWKTFDAFKDVVPPRRA
jgi:predicted pyridoxine 5'-phosphate oxidase superfamily flavin-nucleotide-binding protein